MAEQEFQLKSQTREWRLFGEWSNRVPRVNSLLTADPGPCPVDGIPYTACTGQKGQDVPPAKRIGRTGPRRAPATVDTPAHLATGDTDTEPPATVAGEPTANEPGSSEVASAADERHDPPPEQPQDGPRTDTPHRFPGAPKDGIVLGPDEPVRVRGIVIGREVHLTAPVYRAALPHRSYRWVFQQLYPRGAVVDVAQVQVVTDQPA